MHISIWELVKQCILFRDSPGSPAVKTPWFHGRVRGLDPWWGNQDYTRQVAPPKGGGKKVYPDYRNAKI